MFKYHVSHVIMTNEYKIFQNDENKQAFNNQELEECDYSENSYVIHCFDGCTHKDEEQVG